MGRLRYLPSFPYTAYVLPPSATSPRSTEDVMEVNALPPAELPESKAWIAAR
jgi:hypothetical protein